MKIYQKLSSTSNNNNNERGKKQRRFCFFYLNVNHQIRYENLVYMLNI